MTEHQSAIQSVQVQQLFSGSVASLVTSILLAAILAYMQLEVVDNSIVAGWFVCIVVVSLARLVLYMAYRKVVIDDANSGQWLTWFRMGVLVAGVVWGSAGVLLFPGADVHHQMFLTFILAGLSAGGVITYSADLFSAIAFAVSALLPFALRLLAQGDSLSLAMGMAGLLYIGFMIASMVHINRNLRDNTVLREQAVRNQSVLQESEARFRSMLESSPIATRIAEAGGRRVVFSNQRYDELINVGSGESRGVDPRRYYVRPDNYDETVQLLGQGQRITDKLVELAIPGQGIKWALASYLPFRFEGQDAVLGWFYDITQLKQAEQALQQSEARFREMFERHSSPMLLIEPKSGNIVNANPASAYYYGYSVGHLRAMNIVQINMRSPQEIAEERMLAQREERNYFVFPHRLASGEVRTVEVHSSPVEVDGRSLLFSIIHDITERKQLEMQMHDLAFYDALTKLPNRRLLIDRLNKALITCTRNRRHGALMFLDLDYFKTLNDLHGHDIGDQMLVEVATRILGCIREQDSAARFGGDEFVVMLEGLAENLSEAVTQADLVAEKIRVALAQPYLLKRNDDIISHYCSSSIGVTIFGDHDENLEQLLKWTDIAMYHAKDSGRNAIRYFDPDMQTAIETRAALESDLHTALEQQQFVLFYQVQVNANGKAQGAEVLLRWQHPQRGLVSPAQFIPLAEETGLIISIGAWVLHTACAQIKKWQNELPFRNLVVAVNVSAKQFRQADFVEQVQAVVLQHGINPTSLKLELTESLVLDNVEDTIIKMKALKEFGVSFSMDDFGTGYSSLSYLKRLPLAQIKIDQSFVRDITTDHGDMVMVMTIVDLGLNFEVDVIAEGVETEAQFKLLHRYGCGSFQGYLFSKPVPVAQFEALIAQKLLK